MQLKCPGCARTLKVPDTAAGKVVKCPCGKQLRVPSSANAVASASASGSAAAARPSVSSAQSARPPAQANPRPAAAPPMQFDEGDFEGLADSDWAPAPFHGPSPKARKPAPNPYATSANPYAASGSAMSTSQTESGVLASKGQRFANLLIDQVLMFVVSFAIGLVIGVASVISRGGGELTPQESAQLGLIAQLVGLAATFLYYIVMEAVFGATIGKLCTGTRVVSVKGGRAGFGAIIGRTFARFIPFEPLSFFNSTATGWHDTLSGTRVIRVR